MAKKSTKKKAAAKEDVAVVEEKAPEVKPKKAVKAGPARFCAPNLSIASTSKEVNNVRYVIPKNGASGLITDPEAIKLFDKLGFKRVE